MGRKYSAGKYSAKTYDLGGGPAFFAGALHFTINSAGQYTKIAQFRGEDSFFINFQGDFTYLFKWKGRLTVNINFQARLSAVYKLKTGVIHVPVNIVSTKEYIGPFWGGIDITDFPEIWVPITDPPPEFWTPIAAAPPEFWVPIVEPNPAFKA